MSTNCVRIECSRPGAVEHIHTSISVPTESGDVGTMSAFKQVRYVIATYGAHFTLMALRIILKIMAIMVKWCGRLRRGQAEDRKL